MITELYRVEQNKDLKLSSISTCQTEGDITKEEAKEKLELNIEKMAELQEMMYAHNKYSLLIVIQAMDGAGKDSLIKHVMSGLNPQGTQVYSFKQPSAEELDHAFLWRIQKAVPERGRIGIFNRSHYEEVLVVRVHNLVQKQQLPDEIKNSEDVWQSRFEQIRNFEKYLYENGTRIIKIFLNVSKEEQAKRFLERLEDPTKNWKFSAGDLEERKHWNTYMKCYEEAISSTSTKHAPWYIIPADKKWYTRLVVSEIIIDTLSKMNLAFPEIDEEQKKNIEVYKERLKSEV